MPTSSGKKVIHFHMLFLDGVFTNVEKDCVQFQRTKAPTLGELTKLVHTLSHRVARYLERQGLLVRSERTHLDMGEEKYRVGF